MLSGSCRNEIPIRLEGTKFEMPDPACKENIYMIMHVIEYALLISQEAISKHKLQDNKTIHNRLKEKAKRIYNLFLFHPYNLRQSDPCMQFLVVQNYFMHLQWHLLL